MTKDELIKKVNYQPETIEDLGDFKGSTKFTQYTSNDRSFVGFAHCKSNVLAKTNNAVAMAMCKDSK